MSVGFDLASFEFHASSVTPVVSRNRRFIIVGASPTFLCDKILCTSEGRLSILSLEDTEAISLILCSEHYLGVLDNQDLWVRVAKIEMATIETAANETTKPVTYQWLGLRSQLELLSVEGFQLAGRALQIAQWFYDHQFCGRCGQTTENDDIDRAKICRSCELRFYPRISPCMIVLVTRGEEMLLAHHHRASRLVYTTLAGFVEAGETLEECVRREIKEEVGVSVGKLEYCQSQPWPFPSQLMLGFFAEYESGDICIDQTEIVDAQWFRYDKLPPLPTSASVAGQLIANYLARIDQNNSNNNKLLTQVGNV
jgi:NAD+ diphosphatase